MNTASPFRMNPFVKARKAATRIISPNKRVPQEFALANLLDSNSD